MNFQKIIHFTVKSQNRGHYGHQITMYAVFVVISNLLTLNDACSVRIADYQLCFSCV